MLRARRCTWLYATNKNVHVVSRDENHTRGYVTRAKRIRDSICTQSWDDVGHNCRAQTASTHRRCLWFCARAFLKLCQIKLLFTDVVSTTQVITDSTLSFKYNKEDDLSLHTRRHMWLYVRNCEVTWITLGVHKQRLHKKRACGLDFPSV